MAKSTSIGCHNCLFYNHNEESVDQVPKSCYDCCMSEHKGGPRLPYWAPDEDWRVCNYPDCDCPFDKPTPTSPCYKGCRLI